jgi:hypothetical protein
MIKTNDVTPTSFFVILLIINKYFIPAKDAINGFGVGFKSEKKAKIFPLVFCERDETKHLNLEII